MTEYTSDFSKLRTLSFWFDGEWIENIDAIVEVDRSLNIRLLNVAARNAFGMTTDNYTESCLSGYLSESSTAHLSKLIDQLSTSPAVGSPVWVPEILTVVSATGTSFPAEATLARTDSDEAFSFMGIAA